MSRDGRSREQYVVDKIVYHLGKFEPAERVGIIIKALTELGMVDPKSKTVVVDLPILLPSKRIAR